MARTSWSSFLPYAPVPIRGACLGALVLGLVGALAGLVRGLAVQASTAWFAAFEVGLPAAVLGLLLGAVIAPVVVTFRGRAARRASSKFGGGYGI